MEYNVVKMISLTKEGLEPITYDDYMQGLLSDPSEEKEFEYTIAFCNKSQNILVLFIDNSTDDKKISYIGECLKQEAEGDPRSRKVKIKINNLVKLDNPISAKDYGYITLRKNLTPEDDGDSVKKIVEIYKKNLKNNKIQKRKNYNKQMILYGPPGTGKTHRAKIIASEITEIPIGKVEEEIENADGRIKLVQYHPSYSYFDFIEGVEADQDSNSYVVKDKIFKQLAETAREALSGSNDNHNYVLIIDEINRANIAAVFGELLYGLENRNKEITTMAGTIVIPDNLYIIGTMNTADVSIASIDYAVRRRFDFIRIPSFFPKGTITINKEKYVIGEDTIRDEKGKYHSYSDWFFSEDDNVENCEIVDKIFVGNLYNKVCVDIRRSVARGVNADDIMPGLAYFLVNKNKKDGKIDDGHMNYKIDYQIIPLLTEYAKNGLFSKRCKLDDKETLYDMLLNMKYKDYLVEKIKKRQINK